MEIITKIRILLLPTTNAVQSALREDSLIIFFKERADESSTNTDRKVFIIIIFWTNKQVTLQTCKDVMGDFTII